VRAEWEGKPLVFVLTGGERHEQTVFESLMADGAVRRAGRGRPRIRPERLVGDKGYSAEKVRGYLRRRRVGVVIPHRVDQRASGVFDRRLYRERNRIERLINRLKQFRRIATRYEKRAANYLAMLTLAAILLWL
jgi:transposase